MGYSASALHSTRTLTATLTRAMLLLCLLVGATRPAAAGESFVEGVGSLSLWPDGKVPFVISKSFTPSQRMMIVSALATWQLETHTAIQFVPAEGVYTRYLSILTPAEYTNKTGEVQDGCGSWGPQTVGATYLWLTQPNCFNLPSLLHEIGHTIGLGHEHFRPDRERYMTLPPASSEPIDNAPVGFFDYGSIMHSQPVLDDSVPLDPSVLPPWTTPASLSDGDIDTIRALYAFDIHFESDLVGGDYTNFPLVPEATQRDCQLACAADVRCAAYTYAGTGVLQGKNPTPHCYLKGDRRTIPPFSARPGLAIHAGKRKPAHYGSFGAARHVDLFGGQLSGGVVAMPHNVLNGENCKELCLSDVRCHAFTFVAGKDSGTCFKKSHHPDIPGEPHFTYVQHRDFLSGVILGLK